MKLKMRQESQQGPILMGEITLIIVKQFESHTYTHRWSSTTVGSAHESEISTRPQLSFGKFTEDNVVGMFYGDQS